MPPNRWASAISLIRSSAVGSGARGSMQQTLAATQQPLARGGAAGSAAFRRRVSVVPQTALRMARQRRTYCARWLKLRLCDRELLSGES